MKFSLFYKKYIEVAFSYTTGTINRFFFFQLHKVFPRALSIQQEKFSNLVMFKTLLHIPQVPGKKRQYKTLPKLCISTYFKSIFTQGHCLYVKTFFSL